MGLASYHQAQNRFWKIFRKFFSEFSWNHFRQFGGVIKRFVSLGGFSVNVRVLAFHVVSFAPFHTHVLKATGVVSIQLIVNVHNVMLQYTQHRVAELSF